MLLILATSLLALNLQTDTTVAPSAYLDPAAHALVESARSRRTDVEGAIQRYRTLSRSRLSINVRALGRDRLVYRCESVERVDWRRARGAVVEVIGGREVVPLVSRKVEADDGECSSPVFDPSDDRLSMLLGGLMSSDSAFVRHPLAEGSERDYRFASGDTITIRLPDARPIRLLELRVLPRESSPHLVSGSLWLDQDSKAVVRAVLRLARPYEFARDADLEDREDVPGFVPPLRGDIRFIAIEYVLVDQRWWLPRAIAFEGEGEVGGIARFPMKFEGTYGEYEVEGIAPGAPVLAALPTDSFTCKRSGSVNVGSEGSGVDRDSEPSKELSPIREAPAGSSVKTGCDCNDGRCFQVDRILPNDTASLAISPELPESIYDQDDGLLSDSEMRRILDQVSRGAPAPWQLIRPQFRWGSLDLWRYNRVEGLSGGADVKLELGPVNADATLRLGLADLSPNAEIGVTRPGVTSDRRLAVYRRLDAVGADDRSLGMGNSLTSLLFGRDDGDYFRALGAEVTRTPTGSSDGVSVRAYFEYQSSTRKHTDFSFANVFGDAAFRENIAADEADQAGAEIVLRGSRGLDPAGWRGGATLSLQGEAGSYRFIKPGLRLTGAAPLPASLIGSVEVAGGSTFGEVPVQSLWYLGGARTVRGYEGNSARGNAFWRGRAEVAGAAPGARIVLFSDAGWAGDRDDVQLDPLLLSAGVGVSFLDGLVRLDLARALREPKGWRLDLHLDAAL
jgi:hypothetical protein